MKKYFRLIHNTFIVLFLFDDLQAQNLDLKLSYSVRFEYPMADSVKLGKKTFELFQILNNQTARLASEMETILYCNRTSSNFVLKDRLIADADRTGQLTLESSTIQSGGSYYVDLKEKKRIQLEEMDGEWYRISLPYEYYKWNITDQTKKIMGYTCFKAIADTVIFYSKFRDRIEKTIPIAWFTYDIPIPFGPNGLDQLPGLVLEGNIGGNYSYAYSCKKIEPLDPSNSKKYLKEPSKGKSIANKSYQDIVLYERIK